MSQESKEHHDLLITKEPEEEDRIFPKIAGALVGSAVADALGWVTEFMRSPLSIKRILRTEKLTEFVQWQKKTGGRFNTYLDFVAAGEYSDDTQLALAVARSLRADSSSDIDYFSKAELPVWLDYSRGAGATITAAAQKIRRQGVSYYNNFFSVGRIRYVDSGANGAAMRVAPMALASQGNAKLLRDAFENSMVTHGHPRAIIGSLAYVAAIRAALTMKEIHKNDFIEIIISSLADFDLAQHVPKIESWIYQWEKEQSEGIRFMDLYNHTLLEMKKMLNLAIRTNLPQREVFAELGCFAPRTKGSGTATVAAAIHLFLRWMGDYERAVLDAVNMVPADTDTIAAMAGTLAGAYKGYEFVPDRLTAQLQDLPYFLSIAQELSRISAGKGAEGALRPKLSGKDKDLPEVMGALKLNQIKAHIRVRHTVLGAGWVEGVHVQQILRRSAGTMTYARVRMDMGQTCQFKCYHPRPEVGYAQTSFLPQK